ncbi:hypothetical protein HMPREF0731_4478, partial [Pseudoroseomonas cervicalis ATCC 49957]
QPVPLAVEHAHQLRRRLRGPRRLARGGQAAQHGQRILRPALLLQRQHIHQVQLVRAEAGVADAVDVDHALRAAVQRQHEAVEREGGAGHAQLAIERGDLRLGAQPAAEADRPGPHAPEQRGLQRRQGGALRRFIGGGVVHGASPAAAIMILIIIRITTGICHLPQGRLGTRAGPRLLLAHASHALPQSRGRGRIPFRRAAGRSAPRRGPRSAPLRGQGRGAARRAAPAHGAGHHRRRRRHGGPHRPGPGRAR